MHPHLERVLEIGNSGGAWAKVISTYGPLHELVIVEINPGYSDLIRHYPQIASVLDDPKTSLQTNDGRRWLNHHPDEKFDAIVMNTIHFWRSNSTNLLSREFLEMCKRHLNPGGLLYYNTTDARDSIYTAAHVFKHIITFHNFVAASDSPFNLSEEQKRKNLLDFSDQQGHSLFANTAPGYHQVLEDLVHQPLLDIHDAVLAENDLWLITDDNMASEFRIENHFLPPQLYYALWGKE